MKKIIKENYNIDVDKIYNDFFFYNNEKIFIKKIEKNEKNNLLIENIVKLTNYLYNKKININTILINKNNKYYIEKDNIYYVLIKVNDREKIINKFDIIKIEINNYIDEYDILKELNELKENIEEKNNKNELNKISIYINYFIGLAENSIILLNEYKGNNNYLCHKISKNNYEKEVYNNPFNFIKANYTYDISNYIKYNYYNKNINYDDINYFIDKINNKDDQIYLFSMLMYPNLIFENIEKYDKNKIDKIINDINMYENLLSYIKEKFKYNEYIQKINWLK